MLRRLPGHVLAAALALAALVLVARSASADPPTLSGTWSASGMSESWSFPDWGEICGPKPSPHGAGGGTVQVNQSGSELAMSGGGRAFSTSECWEQMPGLSRTGHSGGSRGWRTTCATPSNDSRQAQIVTSISATDSSISIQETGQYKFLIKGQTCAANVVRVRSMTLQHREGDPWPDASAAASASAAPSATAAPKAAARCSGPAGEPARLEVHPGRKVMKPGEKFAFRAAVLDGDGCPVAIQPTWRIVPGPLAAKATVDPGGSVTIADDAPEGKIDLAIGVRDKGVTVPIEIASAENYDALLAARSLAGEDDTAVAVIATGTIGGKADVADDKAKQRKFTFVALVFGLAACLGFVGLIFARRGKRAERPSMGTDSLAPVSERNSQRTPTPPPTPAARPKRSKGKICPTCGEHYPAEATFCGKDATQLVPLN